MIACPNCSYANQDDARFCAECQAPMAKMELAERSPVKLSEKALLAIEARQRYLESAPRTADLSAQQWYNVCKFFPYVARKASEHSHRPLASVGPHNPLDKRATLGPLLARLRPVQPDPEARAEREAIQSEAEATNIQNLVRSPKSPHRPV